MQKNYELALLVKPILPEDIKSKVISGIEKEVKEMGGEISLSDQWDKRHLAYAINGIEEGYYFFFDLKLNSDKTAKFNTYIRRLQDVLRFLIIEKGNI